MLRDIMRFGATAILLLAACGTRAGQGSPTDRPVLDAVGCRNPLVGEPIGSLATTKLLGRGGEDDTAQPLTLLRWWTVDCPFCRASLPDLAQLSSRFAPRLQLVAVFHPKGAGSWSDEVLRGYLGGLGVTARLARDDDWRVLDSLRRRGGLDTATSISVLVDRQGIVRWVHPGPRLHRSAEAGFAAADRDWRELERVVEFLLADAQTVGR
jgi:hypothetical protein